MSTTRGEAVSIWLSRHGPLTDWSSQGEVTATPVDDTVVLTWEEMDWKMVNRRRRHVFHGTLAELEEQITEIRLGN